MKLSLSKTKLKALTTDNKQLPIQQTKEVAGGGAPDHTNAKFQTCENCAPTQAWCTGWTKC